eukprot:CAMPEP_0184411044 /NCGR_PEP_ID=MMETSP0738-20130409/5353_1 /TAXON_ID=385413 /ORGANISM="Thalassiosira miniscula, Strain CCMP1093" /LENGTH=101 /DNA_ID=CAMNT_0026769189 /DNA_START=54 /DNA_END=356 /DNA_ORIENTATION=-
MPAAVTFECHGSEQAPALTEPKIFKRSFVMKVVCLSTALVLSAAGAAHAVGISGATIGAWGPIDASKGFAVSNNDKGATADVTWGVEWQSDHKTGVEWQSD